LIVCSEFLFSLLSSLFEEHQPMKKSLRMIVEHQESRFIEKHTVRCLLLKGTP
jgi:hypothetical protein